MDMGRFRYFLCYLRPRMQALLLGFALFGLCRLMIWVFALIFPRTTWDYLCQDGICSETAPTWSPDGSQIMFVVDDTHIYISDANGDYLLCAIYVGAGGWRAINPNWSPDGKRIVYARSNGRDYAQIRAANADGGNRQELSTSSVGNDIWAAWSPDGTRIAYISYAGQGALWVMSADGNYRWQVAHDAMNPVWSPDGSTIAYEHSADGEIYIQQADGGGDARNLTRREGKDTSPAWSPDGATIVFVSDRDGNEEIYVVNADGSNPHNLTHNAAKDHSPVWSPDGTRIAFISDHDGYAELYVMDADGSNQRQIANTHIVGIPAWSPDSRSLAFAAELQAGNPRHSRVYVMDVDSPNARCLTCLD